MTNIAFPTWMSLKATPLWADILLIADSVDSNAAKYTTIASIPVLTSQITWYTESVQDIVGAMMTTNSYISFTYDDTAWTVVADIVNSSIVWWKLANGTISYAKIQDASANGVLCRASSSSWSLGTVTLSASQLFWRGDSGDLAAITLWSWLSMSWTTLSATWGGGGSPWWSNTQIQYNNSWSFGGIPTVTYSSSIFKVQDDYFAITNASDTTKLVVFNAAGITTGQQRTLTVPDASWTLVLSSATQTVTNKTLDNTTTLTIKDANFTLQDNSDTSKQVQFQLSSVSASTTRTITVPDADITLVWVATAQTLTNKTLTAPVISTISNTWTLTLPTSSDTLVWRATTDTLTNKTLTAPVIATIVNSGTLTLPTSTDTLVGRATTDTLTNKLLQLPENWGILLDAALSADGKWSWITETWTAWAALAFWDVVYLSAADSRWELADADAAATAWPVKVGICVLAANADWDPTEILLYGKVRADAAFPTLTIWAPVYISTTAGDVQVAAPSGSADIVRILWYGNTADELFFCPDPSFIELA